MITPEPMKKVRIVALRSIYDELVNALGKLGVLHITKVKDERLTPPDVRKVKELEAKVLSIASLFSHYHLPQPMHILTLDELEEKVKALWEKLSPLIQQLPSVREAKAKMKALAEDIRELENIRKLFGNIRRPRLLKVALGIVDAKSLGKLKEALPKPSSLFVKSAGRGRYYALVFSKEDPQVAFSKVNAYIVDLFSSHSSLDEHIKALKDQLKALEEKVKAFYESLRAFYSQHALDLSEVIYSMEAYRQRESVEHNFALSKYFVVLEGWVPAKLLSKLKEKLAQRFPRKALLEVVKTKEEPPTKLSNPYPIKPFEEIVKMISLPSARELDPSFIYFFTIPFIYGMIIGDVIYSLISIVIAYALKKRFKHPLLHAVADIWILSSVFGIAWGIFYDEWAASSHTFWLAKLREFGFDVPEKLYDGFGRVNKVAAVIGMSIVVGIVYLSAGFILGFINALREGHLKHAVAKLAWLSTFLAMFYAIGIYMNYIPGDMNIALIWFALSAVALLITEGPIAILEIPSLFGNAMSFARIAAVGVVGAVMGELINHYFAPSPAAGLLNILLLPILVSLHFANSLLAMFEGLIQGGRLNLVEFSTKFFHGGGYPYKPFSFSRGDKDG